MHAIWKYEIPLGDRFAVEMPESAQVVAVGVQADGPVMWVLVDPDEPRAPRTFLLATTGRDFELGPNDEHVGTFQVHLPGGTEFVGHVFELWAREGTGAATL